MKLLTEYARRFGIDYVIVAIYGDRPVLIKALAETGEEVVVVDSERLARLAYGEVVDALVSVSMKFGGKVSDIDLHRHWKVYVDPVQVTAETRMQP